MTLPTRDELLALNWTYNGQPFARVTAKSTVSTDATYRGEPFLPTDFGDSEPPGDPPEIIPTYLELVFSAPPMTSTTFVRETGDVLLMEGGFTLIEETGTLSSPLPTMELFTTSTPTAGTWVLGRYYLTNAKTDGVLRSPSPSLAGADESATLTLVVTAPRTYVSFDFGVRGRQFGSPTPEASDLLRFYLDDVEQMVAYPVDVGGDVMDLITGNYGFTLLPGTYDLRWQWLRTDGTTWNPLEAHAWITNLLIDPTD
jgi:hypothetical protein